MNGDITGALPEQLQADPVAVAAVHLLGRTGARDFGLHQHDAHDDEPTLWIATGTWPRPDQSEELFREADAALDPTQAVMRLAERMVDGGQCTYCHRRAMLWMNVAQQPAFGALVCWTWYNPVRQEFQRACLGLTPADRQN